MKPLILIIEDEPAIVDAITYALHTDGFDTAWASTGRDGLARLAQPPVALVVLDIGLPDGSGFDLFREIRKSHDVPVIFLTARAAEVDRIVGLELGADDYVVKPFSPRELSARVKAVLRRARPEAAVPEPPTNSRLPFAVDEDRCLIAYFGRTLELSRYEYRLLLTLIRRPGWVFSREKLMDLVWDVPESSLERTVDTHVKTIRGKLRAVRPDVEAIVTHRGMGYALREDW
jgi:two-component system catabolic regulation response regulator CreB